MITWFFALFSGFCSSMQSTFTKLGSTSSGKNGAMAFNAFKVGFGVLLFGVLSAGQVNIHFPTAIYALVYGTSLSLSTFCGYLALMKGSMALTSLIVSYSVVIPCIFGFVYGGEVPTLLKISGLCLLMLSMYMLRKKSPGTEFKKGWLLCVSVTFICNGICSVVQKLHQTNYPGEYLTEFTLFSFALIFAVFVIAAFVKREKPSPSSVKFALPAGVAMGLMNYLTLALSSKLDASVLFPAVTVFTAVFNYVVSKILFKEKFSKMQITGIALGILSVIFIK